MRKVYLLVIIISAFVMTHCASTKETSPGVYVNSQKLNGRSFHKLFVEVQTVDIQLRTIVENVLVEALASKGYSGAKSIDLIPFSLKDLKLPTEDEIKLKAKESGCDGILLISLSRKGETLEYSPGTVRKGNEQLGAGLLGGAINKGGDIKAIPAVNTQGSFSHSGADFIFQSNIYDLPAAELMFSTQSGGINVLSPDETSKTYATGLVAQLISEKLLRK
jgi:hypothetical protein